MKRLTLPLMILLVACGETPTDPTDASLPEPSMQALATTSSLRVPFATGAWVPCAASGAGETVLVTGTLHVLSHTTVDARGGIHVTGHFQPMGAAGTGLTTGDVYRGTGVTRETFNVNAGGLPLTDTFVNNFRMIGQGRNNNLLIHQVVHVTVNENGTVTAAVNLSSAECR